MLRSLKKRARYALFRLQAGNKEKFECPVCEYAGPFKDSNPSTGLRKHAMCPNCEALERHRILFLVIKGIRKDINTAELKMLHFAPEPFFRKYFSKWFAQYETADIAMKDVDHKVDIQQLPFEDQTFDFVLASHVLEHIPDDEKALSEIRRILRPGGIAVLPVPVVAEKTIEYPEPNPQEAYHVRAPGPDYFERYERHFSRVERYRSDTLPEKYQLFIYEDRSHWPTPESPLRRPMPGERHIDIVPVCYV